MSDTDRAAVKSADRVLDVLELLARSRHGRSHSEIATALDIPKSSLTGLLRNLAERDYLAVDAAKLFSIGPAVATLLRGSQTSVLADLAAPLLAELTARTGESSGLYVFREQEIERIAGLNSDHALLYSMSVGKRFAAHTVSAGKVIVANLPEEEQAFFFRNAVFPKVTPHTLSETAFRRQLPETRQTGFGYSVEEGTVGLTGIATPILDGAGYPLGALSIVLPASRFDDAAHERIKDGLRMARNRIEARLRG